MGICLSLAPLGLNQKRMRMSKLTDQLDNSAERLIKVYRATMVGGISNDHDYIALCRPIDLLRAHQRLKLAIHHIEKLQGQIHDCPDCGEPCVQCECWDKELKDAQNENKELKQYIKDITSTKAANSKTPGLYVPDNQD